MFLSTLNEEEKLNFCRLVQLVVNCDNDFSAEERTAVQDYQGQMGIETLEPVTSSLDEVVDFFAKRTDRIRNGIFIEIVTLVMSDERYEICERYIVDKMARSFNINNDQKSKYLAWVMDKKLINTSSNKKSSTSTK